MEFLISDTHLWHRNIIEFEVKRGELFNDVEEMNEYLIKVWNETVSEDDVVYHLGDFGMNIKYDKFVELLSKLNGKIILCQGNHDSSKVVKKLENEGLIELHEVGLKIKRNKHIMWLTHYPMEIGLRPRKWSISGHIHSEPSRFINQINVGIDSDFMCIYTEKFGQPVPMDKLIEYMDSVTPQIEDYYTELRGNRENEEESLFN